MDTCENIPLSIEEDMGMSFLNCFDCVDTNWATFEASSSVQDLYSCINSNGYGGDGQAIARAFMMGGG